MNVVFIAAECAPFAKVGGLADVVSSLPPVLVERGHDVRVVLPHHGIIDDARFKIEHLDSFEMMWAGGTARIDVSFTRYNGVRVYFVKGWPYITGSESFVYDANEGVNVGRYLFFSAAALAFINRRADMERWRPDVLHAHDWHTGMVPFLAAKLYPVESALRTAAVVFSIHNMQYQGWGVGWHLDHAGLPPVDNHLLAATGKNDNCLAVGLAYSTMVSTVSPSYAEEILSSEGAHGLDGVILTRRSRMRGILNGIDPVRWNPASEGVLEAPFDAERLDEKARNKAAIQRVLGLPVKTGLPLVGIITRLVDQKGPEIMVPALRHMLYHAEMQVISLGSGDPHWEHEFWKIGSDYPSKAIAYLGFDEVLAEQIYAASDLFLMPSKFEPCGLGQMIAMRYGALPVVHAVGGLRDSVPSDVGFLFNGFHYNDVITVLTEALDMYYNRPRFFRQRQKRAMSLDFSWGRSAKAYEDLYTQAVDYHHQYLN